MDKYNLHAIIEKLKNGYLDTDTFQKIIEEKIRNSTNENNQKFNQEDFLDDSFSEEKKDSCNYEKLILENSSNAQALLYYDENHDSVIIVEFNTNFLKKINSQTESKLVQEDLVNLSLKNLLYRLNKVSQRKKDFILSSIANINDSHNKINYIEQLKNDKKSYWNTEIKLVKYEDKSYFLYTSQDVSQQKRIQKEIKEKRQQYHNIFNAVNDVILVHHADTGEILDTNQKAIDLFGYSLEQIKKGGIALLNDPTSLFKAENIIRNIQQTTEGKEQVLEWKVRDIKNNNYWLEMSLKSSEIMGKTRVLAVCRNISGRKRIENRLSKLSNRLLKQNKSLEYKEQELIQYNEELKNKQKELENTLKELSARNFELDQLVYKISHDLRSPLSSILGLVDIIQNESNPQNQSKYLNYIENRVRKLDGFIKAMLNYAKANRSESQIVLVNFEKIINSCMRDLEYLDNFKNMKTKVYIEGNKNDFWADELRISIIFNNIISNAYKYMNLREEQSFLKIHISIHETSIDISFKDNGIGIPENFLEKIFDMFFRATNKSEGSGLGMYIVKQTIEKLEGTIKIESKVNQGTNIYISLPK